MRSWAALSREVWKMSEKVITKQDLVRCNRRLVLSRQMCFNYENMQAGGWVWAMMPALERIYGDDKETIIAKNRQYFQFYNTHPWISNLIMAACIAIEETKDPDATEAAIALRTGLMGPLAGIGDAIIWVMFPTIFGAIAAYQALDGSVVGWIIAEAVNVAIWLLFYKMFYTVYDQGVSFITSRATQLSCLTDACSVLGLIVVGALVASTVSVKAVMTFKIGEVSQTLQSMMDAVMPKFLNIAAVGAIYAGLGKKGMTTVKMVWIIIIASIALAAAGILG